LRWFFSGKKKDNTKKKRYAKGEKSPTGGVGGGFIQHEGCPEGLGKVPTGEKKGGEPACRRLYRWLRGFGPERKRKLESGDWNTPGRRR